MNTAGPPVPWLVASSPDGELRLTWTPPAEPPARANLLVCLRPIPDADLAAFWAGDLDADIIRHPVRPEAAAAILRVPAGRELHLALVWRHADGTPEPAETLRLLAPAPAPRTLEAPVSHVGHEGDEPGAAPELVFVEGTRSPDLESLARRVALSAAGGRALPAAAPSAEASQPFAARQRWSLIRLAFTPPASAPLQMVRRSQVIDPSELATFADAPPADAIALPPDTDGVIDAEPAPDAIAFYCVLAGPAPWRPLPLAPMPPPFDSASRPALLGPVEARLGAAIDERLERLERAPLPLGELPLALDLLDAALRCLPPTAPLRQRITARLAAHARTPAF
ncbi:MAG: hypothetical protein H6744_07600 [Deltaproteobacteria bacterium]|nr:hypothetical protein [Deltaproteobacteria bacterium]MCB9786544.1 hypothetical protein [Deltaproteobacteria bacterium]